MEDTKHPRHGGGGGPERHTAVVDGLPGGVSWRLAVLCFIVGWGVLAAPWLSGQLTIPYDAKAHFQAQLQFLAHSLHAGQSPFWAPYVFVGTPHIADPQSLIFSPVILLALLDPSPDFVWLDGYVLVLLGMAGAAMLGLARDLGWHPAAGVMAAFAVAFGGSAAWRIQHVGQIQSLAFMCLAIWLLQRAMSRRSWRSALAAGLAIGLMLATPNQVGLLGAYLMAFMVLGRWLSSGEGRRAFRAEWPPVAIAAALAIALAAVPVALTLLYMTASNRPEITYLEAVRGSLHPASLLTLFFADLYGAGDTPFEYWGPHAESWDPTNTTLSRNMGQLWFGALPAILLAAAIVTPQRLLARESRVVAVSAALVLAFALGGFTPLFKVLHALLPGVASFRRPADATLVLGPLIAWLAGHALDRALQSAPVRDTSKFGVAPAMRRLRRRLPGLPTAWPMAWPEHPVRCVVVLAGMTTTALAIAHWQGQFAIGVRQLLIASVWLSTAVIVLAATTGRAACREQEFSSRSAVAVLLVAAFMVADLRINNGPSESTGLPPAAFDVLLPASRNETLAALAGKVRREPGTARRDRVELVGLGFEWQNVPLVHRLEATLGYNPLRMDDVSRAAGAGDYIAGPDQRRFTPLFPSYRSLLADLLGLRWIASSVPIEEVDRRLPGQALRLVAQTRDAWIYENPRALPRVLVVEQASAVSFADLIRHGRWPAFDPARTVLFDADASLPVDRAGGKRPSGTEAAAAAINRYENTVIEVDVTAPGDRWLVLNDVWHPWWRASVDGVAVPIRRANVMFRAVRVPAGRHHVRFAFHPFAGALEEWRQRTRRLLGRKQP